MTNANELEREQAVSTAERLEDAESMDDIEPLDVKITAGLDGEVRRVVLVITTGGPHIEADATAGTVTCNWGGDGHTAHCDSDALEAAGNYYRRQFEEHVVA